MLEAGSKEYAASSATAWKPRNFSRLEKFLLFVFSDSDAVLIFGFAIRISRMGARSRNADRAHRAIDEARRFRLVGASWKLRDGDS